jgi:hypothetical protein
MLEFFVHLPGISEKIENENFSRFKGGGMGFNRGRRRKSKG